MATTLLAQIRTGEMPFPFRKTYMKFPEELFANLKQYDLPVAMINNYRLYSYYPQYQRYLPPKFLQRSVIIEGTHATYDTIDSLSDFFVEDIRLKAKRYDQDKSVLECWTDDECLKPIIDLAIKGNDFTPRGWREAIYANGGETKIFNPTWAKALLKLVMGPDLAGKRWLDISAGWGDRLLTAMALNMNYTGYDPNTELQPGHSAMIAKFGSPNRYRVVYEPFEKSNQPQNFYDVVLSSPPYFNVEEYAVGQPGQSIVSYPKYEEWMASFLFTSIQKACEALKPGGYLILHLGDTKTTQFCEPTNIFIEQYLLNMSWEGVIGLQGESGYPRPVWVWKKMVLGGETMSTRKLWKTRTTLYDTYRELQITTWQALVVKYAPNFVIRKSNFELIKSQVTYEPDKLDPLLVTFLLGTLPPDTLIQQLNVQGNFGKQNSQYIALKKSVEAIRDKVSINFGKDTLAKKMAILRDISGPLLIISLLEAIGEDGTIKWLLAMINLS